ncbi:hypothetical protein HN588_13865 [Candidatus Bathyarchaeota archaeon]|nr:hypothetical protein [Candidatus Bathyarchaeota archaeon]
MATQSHAPCPRHTNVTGVIRFILPSADGCWVFFYACQRCHEHGMQKSCYMVLDVTEEEMHDLMASASKEMLEIYMAHPVNIGGQGG